MEVKLDTHTLTDKTIGRIHVKERDDITAWMERGLCRQMGVQAEEEMGIEGKRAVINLFYPTRHEGPEDVQRAKSVCFQCPVRVECVTYSMINYEKVGIWGGTGEKERRVLRRKLRAEKVPRSDTLAWIRDHKYEIGKNPRLKKA